MSLLTSLNAYYKLDESSGNITDATGNGNTGTNTNTVTFSSGVINNQANFAGASSQYFSVGDSSSISITGDMSIAGWTKFTDAPGAFDYTFVEKWSNNADAQKSYTIQWYDNAGTKKFFFANSDDGSTAASAEVTWAFSTATEYHVAIVYTASAGSVSFWVNGSQQGTTQSGLKTSIFDGTSAMRIGAGYNSTGSTVIDFMNGSFDEIGIWARVLTSGEISSLYGAGAGLQYPFGESMIKTFDGIANANIKTSGGLARASVKTFNGIS